MLREASERGMNGFRENTSLEGGRRAPSRRLPGSTGSPLGDRLPPSPHEHHFHPRWRTGKGHAALSWRWPERPWDVILIGGGA